MSKNVYKSSWVRVSDEEKCLVDSNSRLEERIAQWETLRRTNESAMPQYDGSDEGEAAEFVSGIGGEEIDALFDDGDRSNVIKAGAEEAGPDLEAIRAEAQEILDSAQAQADEMIRNAQAEIEVQRRQAQDAGNKQGYNEGYQQGLSEVDDMKRALMEEKRQLEQEFEQLVEELEPEFIDTITAVYNHIFSVDLADNRDILVHLIDSTLRKVESSRTFIVHVSAEDYPYVNMQKQALVEGAVAGRGLIEIIEDIALIKGDCLIETDGGIFDCGIGTQLEELTRKLRVLSFEKTE
ncbi:MAG: hypothetical protein HFI62_12645 [Lachnospiraceae bacterium]|nr:hypothetical protein [Lachnospiraceae bacterium]